ncbi:uncharacterized protein LOC122857959 isoform X2 [Aphidius gifuensis]|nr:uncharacterized protein LOC122857959 isoform X2 [Aphidius gifuensis]XP_044016473.1 uncharacterized protein LOC122857959 isoform X2 [Aphidius gifuensis]
MGSSSNDDLVVKWYVNDDLLYQWIYGSKPRASEEYMHYIDSTYNASTDPNMEYRAVKLIKPSHLITGKIRCSISAQDGEDEASRDMLVYSPEKVFRLLHPKMSHDSRLLIAKCLAEDIFPKPIIKILRDNQTVEEQKVNYKLNPDDGRYSAETVVELRMAEIQLPTTFECQVSIKSANYTSNRKYVYNDGNRQNFSLTFIIIISILVAGTTIVDI